MHAKSTNLIKFDKILISNFLSSHSSKSIKAPAIVHLENEPIDFTTEFEELTHLPRMKKAVDDQLEKEEKAAKSGDLDKEKDVVGADDNLFWSAPANKSSTQADGKPSNKDELGFPVYDDQIKSQTGGLMYEDELKKAEEENKKKEANLQAREESSNSTSDDTSKDKINNESIHKLDSENATHPSDHSTVAPVTQSTSKIIDTLKSSTSPKEIRNESVGKHNNGTHPSSAASVHQPTIFSLFISFVLICFIF